MKKRGFKMRSGNNTSFKKMGSSPNKFSAIPHQENIAKNMKAMMEARKAGGDDFDMKAWTKENLEGGMLGTLKNQGEGGEGEGFGTGIGGIVAGIKGGIAGRKGKMAAMHDKLHGKGGETTGPDLQPSPLSKVTYAQAKAKDSNLDKYIAERKKYKAGSKEYETIQAKINAAYGTKRSEKLKTAQIKKHKDDPSRKGSTKKETTITRKEYVPQTVSPRKEYDPASRNKRKEYIPQSQK